MSVKIRRVKLSRYERFVKIGVCQDRKGLSRYQVLVLNNKNGSHVTNLLHYSSHFCNTAGSKQNVKKRISRLTQLNKFS